MQTKDLSDCLMVTVTDLLHASLDRHSASLNRLATGSTNMAGLRSGREFERQAMHTANETLTAPTAHMNPMERYFASEAEKAERRMARAERNRGTLERNKLDRARRNAFGSRSDYVGDRSRGRM